MQPVQTVWLSLQPGWWGKLPDARYLQTKYLVKKIWHLRSASSGAWDLSKHPGSKTTLFRQRLENDLRVKENSLNIDQSKSMTLRVNFPFNIRSVAGTVPKSGPYLTNITINFRRQNISKKTWQDSNKSCPDTQMSYLYFMYFSISFSFCMMYYLNKII